MYRMTYVFEESDTQYYYNIILYITRAVIVISLLGYCIAAVYITIARYCSRKQTIYNNISLGRTDIYNYNNT